MLGPIFQPALKSLEKSKVISYAKAKKAGLNVVNISDKVIPRLPRMDADIKQGLLV